MSFPSSTLPWLIAYRTMAANATDCVYCPRHLVLFLSYFNQSVSSIPFLSRKKKRNSKKAVDPIELLKTTCSNMRLTIKKESKREQNWPAMYPTWWVVVFHLIILVKHPSHSSLATKRKIIATWREVVRVVVWKIIRDIIKSNQWGKSKLDSASEFMSDWTSWPGQISRGACVNYEQDIHSRPVSNAGRYVGRSD